MRIHQYTEATNRHEIEDALAFCRHPANQAIFETFSAMLSDRWRILLMSDRVWKYIQWERLREIARGESGQNVASALRHEASGQSSYDLWDDFSLLFIDP